MIENKNKCLLFKTSNLEYFKTISNVELGKIVYSDDYYIPKYKSKKSKKGEKNKDKEIKQEEKILKQNKCVIAYQDSNNKKLIHFIDFIFNENGTKILGIRNKIIEVDLNSNEIKTFAFVSSYLLVSSSFGNKVHLYNIETGEFKYCLILGNFPYEISGLHFDNKEKIMSIITNNKYVKFYKLNKLNVRCKCASHNDEKISMNQTRGMFDKFKHKLGVGRNDFLCRYKINAKEFDMKDNKTLIFFDKNVNDVFFLVQNNKVVKRLKFDRKKKKDMILLHEAILPKYTVNKNDLRTLTLIIEEEKNEKENEDKRKKKEDEQKQDNNIWDDDDIEENENKSDEKKEDIKEKKDK